MPLSKVTSNSVSLTTLTTSGAVTLSNTLGVTGVTTVQAGTAALPAITTTGDTNTGIFFPAADTIAFSEGGAEAMRIDSSGRVGIGTTSPSAPLHVQAITGGLAMRFTGRASPADGYSDIGFFNNANTTQFAGLGVSNAGVYLSAETAIPIIFYTNATERMRINAGAPILCLSGGSTTATGTGIAFPATQSASTDANTLDDYEEGTWTPVLVPATGTITSSTVNGSYVKIGSQVTITFKVVITGGTVTALTGLSGIPFAFANLNQVAVGVARETQASGELWQVNAVANTTTTNMWRYNNSNSSINNTYGWQGSITYIVAN